MSHRSTIKKEWRGREVKIVARRVSGKTAFEVGLLIEGQAKLLCPVKTGRLAASITTRSTTDGTLPRGKGAWPSDFLLVPESDNIVHVGTPVEYGPYIEFGTMQHQSQAFLRPAMDLAKGKALTVIEKNGRIEFKEYLR